MLAGIHRHENELYYIERKGVCVWERERERENDMASNLAKDGETIPIPFLQF